MHNEGLIKIKYGCIFLALLLLSAPLVSSPAQARSNALEWRAIEKPGEDGNLVVSPSEVSDLAVGRDDVIYTIDSENWKLYRSLNSGVTWEDITDNLADEGAKPPASKIAVAPDKPDIVAVVTDDGTEVYLSTDAGEDWTNTGVPSLTGTIQAIAISREYTISGDDYREIAIGTAEWGDGSTTGQLWVYQIGSYPLSWQNQELTADPAHTGGEVSAIAYSPDYEDDATILVIASTSTGSDIDAAYQDKTFLCLLERDTGNWNDLTGYPVKIEEDGGVPSAGDGSGVSWIHSSLALPSNYSNNDEEPLRQLFVSYDREPEDAGDDVYWLNDYTPYRLDIDDGNAIDINSIAYYGSVTSGKLLAGEVNPVAGSLTVPVWQTSEPLELSPTWHMSSVPPTGPGNAKVGWSHDGKIAYCGTGQLPGEALDESAFSVSLDDGDKWRQLGLMDTVIRLADIVPAPDGESLFLTTYNSYGPESVWRTAGDPLGENWERLLTMDTSGDVVILRLSPNYDDDYTMYAAEIGGDQLAVTHNRGNSWKWLLGTVPGPVIDIAVADEGTVYAALSEGYITKSLREGVTWHSPVETHLSDINMLTIVGEDTILVGGRKGDVAYSNDGGESFIQISEAIASGAADVQVIADSNYEENGTIYAATNLPDGGIWRWVIGVSTQWEQIDESVTRLEDGQSIGGLAVGPEGTLYALRLEQATSTTGGVVRSLNPLEADPAEVEFDLVNDLLAEGTAFDPTAVFPNTLPYLKLSGNAVQNELWTIDTDSEIIYRFQDTLCKVGPDPVMPEAGDIVPVDSSGYITSLTLSWEELEGAEEYEAVIYQDPDATQSVWSETTAGIALNAARASDPAQLISGLTYHWRVRGIEPLKSPWSEMRSFAPALGAGQWSPMTASSGVSPLPGAMNVPVRPTFAWQPADEATGYEFLLARDSGFTDVVIEMSGADALPSTVWGCDRDLDYSTTYFWKIRAINASGYSEWGTGVFTTEAAPLSPPPQQSSPQPSPPPAPTPVTPFYVFAVVGIGVLLVVSLLVLIIRTGRKP